MRAGVLLPSAGWCWRRAAADGDNERLLSDDAAARGTINYRKSSDLVNQSQHGSIRTQVARARKRPNMWERL